MVVGVRAAAVAGLIACVTGLGGCVDALGGRGVEPASVSNLPPGSSEDFVVNVGRRTYFTEGSAELDSVAKETLGKQAAWLTRNGNWTVKIQGFSDDPGSPDANRSLSARRAGAVKTYLASLGVADSRMSTKGYGRERLVRDCSDLSCKSQNRRVITNLVGDRDL